MTAINIENSTILNKNYRWVIYTTSEMQLVLMSLKPGEEIGLEVHKDVSQFLRIESGVGIAQVGDMKYAIKNSDAVIVPKGVKHNIINTSLTDDLKLYTIYSPPNHKDGLIQQVKPKDD